MKRLFTIIIGILGALTASAVEGESPFINTRAPEFTLQDQYGKTVTLKQFEGSVLVLIASDKEGSGQNGPWKKALLDRYRKSIAIAGLADVRTVPFFMNGVMKSSFKKEEGSVLMDWKAEVFKALGLREHVSNIVVIDRQGYLRYMTSGAATQASIDMLCGAIDRLK